MFEFLAGDAAGVRDGRLPSALERGGGCVRRGAARRPLRALPAAREPCLAAGSGQVRARRRRHAVAAQDAPGVSRVSNI